jgi:hypothetical protein
MGACPRPGPELACSTGCLVNPCPFRFSRGVVVDEVIVGGFLRCGGARSGTVLRRSTVDASAARREDGRSLACVLHGMGVIAFANRYSHNLRPAATAVTAGAVVPLVLPALVVMLFFVALIPVVLGLALTVVVTRFGRVAQIARSRAALVTGRVAIAVVAIALLPGTVNDLHDVIVRDESAAVPKPRVADEALSK